MRDSDVIDLYSLGGKTVSGCKAQTNHKGGLPIIGFGIMLAFAGAVVLIAGAAQAAKNRSFASCTKAVMGTVTSKQSRNVKNGKSHELTVTYTVDNTEYQKVVGVLLTEYNSISEGDKLELRYKPKNPKRSVRPEVLNSRNVRIVLIVGAVLIVMGIALFFVGRM